MTFTNDELYMLSGAVLCAIAGNHRAADLACGEGSINALLAANRQLRDLNAKLCAMMKGGDGTIDTADGDDKPNVLIKVYGGLVQAVYSSIPEAVSVSVYDEDDEEYFNGPDEEFNDLSNRPEYKMIW